VILPETFHFLRPAWLGALLPLAVFLWLFARRRLRSRGWEAVCDPALLPHVLIGGTGRAGKLPLLLAAAGGLLAIGALAGPVWRQLPQPLYSGGSALVIALDLSRSMEAADLKPSRIVRARFKVADILNLHREGQTALIVFAGDAFTVTPLTDDVETIRSQLNALSTDIMPAQGSRGDKALALAGDLLKQAGLNQGQVLLVTDEIEAGRGVEAARALNAAGYRVSVLGVGTETGAPIPAADGGFLKSASGEIVIPRLDENALQSVATAGGGRYAPLSVDDTDLNDLAGVLAGEGEPAAATRSEFRADLWREEGPWLVLLLLPLAALAFRRGYMFMLPLLLVLPPRPAEAFGWDDLWLRPDQQGQRALDAGDPARAAELFRDPALQGAARYRAGDFDGAAKVLEPLPEVETLYNRGNALARAGRLDDAIAAYSEVLRQDPAHADALYNKELLEKEKEKEQQQNQQSQQDQQGEQNQAGQDQASASGQSQGQKSDPQDQAQNAPPSGGDDPGNQASPGQDGQDDRQQQDAGNEAQKEDRERAEAKPSPDQKPAEPRPQEQQPGPAMQAEKKDAAAGDEKQRLAGVDDESTQPDEEQLAAEQWLRRIPDDPGGLLRRKFRYQYQQRARAPGSEEQSW